MYYLSSLVWEDTFQQGNGQVEFDVVRDDSGFQLAAQYDKHQQGATQWYFSFWYFPFISSLNVSCPVVRHDLRDGYGTDENRN